MSTRIRQLGLSVVTTTILIAALCGCNTPKEGSGLQATADEAAEPPDSSSTSGIQPCKLLTSAQVSTVLPGHDGGMVAHSGGSLTKGIDAYQCSYVNRSAGLMTVILNVAQNEELFSWIKPSEGSHREHRKIDIADRAWVYGEEDDLRIEVVKGLTVLELKLMDKGAQAKSDAMIELARILVEKIQ